MIQTIRAKLTATYAALFLVIGAVLLVLMYVMLSSALDIPKKYTYGNGYQAEHAMPGSAEEWEQSLEWAKIEQRDEALRLVKITAAISLGVAFLGALGIGWLFAGRMLQPVSEITAHAKQLGESTLDQRIDMQGADDELKELADTIDDMLSRLEQSFESQKRFAAQASHELRTPLAIIGGEADVTLADPEATEREKETARAVRAQVDRSQRLVEGLLVLARSDANVTNFEQIDLADLAGDALEAVVALADRAHIEIDLELDTAPIMGDGVLLHALVGNLYVNAIQYNRPGGWVRVKVWSDDESSMLRVENCGNEISSEEIERLFRPFQRGRGLDQDDRQQGGFGLGMAIVRSVTGAHNGEIEAVPREGGGLDITVKFPSSSRMIRYLRVGPDS